MNYELFYSEGKPRMRGMMKGNNPDELINRVMSGDVHEWELFKASSGFHSTTQEEYLVYWYSRNDNSYYANRSKRDPNLAKKEYSTNDSVRESFLFNTAKSLLMTESSDIRLSSDIIKAWDNPKEITQDIREYFVQLMRSGEDDYVIEDRIKAITNGIKEFRKISGI